MRINKPLYLVIAMLVFITLGLTAGCSKKAPETNPEPPAEGLGPEEPLESQDTGIMEGRTSGPMLPVYFAFDDSNITGDQVQRIEGNAAFLSESADVTIRIEGNCDPRGTKEYNLALGERRAQSAKAYLINLGIDSERLSTVSWGEEKLLLFGHDELSWAQNRRADFVIVK
ncbi:OmpA family protein [Desulfogranum japonicum]|uniref:OmpA family protein n=1 Tax=Desulfogranum japonicum TaxID=231447 RepID=UPI00040AF6E0|nr:OmpA family protein [Desulfogranum japonicum]